MKIPSSLLNGSTVDGVKSHAEIKGNENRSSSDCSHKEVIENLFTVIQTKT